MPKQNNGIEWIGRIPITWELKKIKFLLKQRIEKNNPVQTKDILSLTAKQGVIPLSEKEGGGNKPKEDITGYVLAYPGDIVMNSMNVLSGSVGLSKYFGCVSPVYYMLKPLNGNDDVRFYNYIFQTKDFQNSLLGLGNGILIKESDNGKYNTIRMRIPIDKLFNLMLPSVSPVVQNNIADLLDIKCAEIDSLHADIEKQIDVLEQYKKSVITEAVTKGLDPNVEMKDSGIKWIGKIPKNWAVLRLKYSSTLKGRIGWQGLRSTEYIDEGPFLITGTDFENGIINWNTCAHISERRYDMDMNIQVKDNDLLITKDGTIGKTAIVKNSPEKVSLNSGVFIIRNDKKYKYVDKYMYYIINSNVFTLWYELNQQGNSTIRHLTQDRFYNFAFPYLGYEEQQQIVEYLDSKCAEIDSAIADKKKQLETLEAYKKSLIYEYVTGKKEV